MYGSKSRFYNLLWTVRRLLRASPMQRVLRGVERRGVKLSELDALEVFGADGSRHTADYAGRVRSLTVWEFDDRCIPALRARFPAAEVRNVDSFQEIETTGSSFGLLVIDDVARQQSRGRYTYEHFDLITPPLFQVLADRAVLVLNVFPDAFEMSRRRRWDGYTEYMAARAAFYGVEEAERVPLAAMAEAYERHVTGHGFHLDWSFAVRRTRRTGVYYMALGVSRMR